MAQDMNILAAAQRKFEQDKERRQAAFDRRVQQIYLRLPRLQEIDRELRGTAGRIVMAALESDGDPGPAMRELERQIVTFEGKRLWINTNQFLSSRHVQEIRKMPRADVPGAYDLALKLSDSGVRIWTMLAQQFSQEPMIMLIDDYYQCSFNPQPLADVDTNWVVISFPFDEFTAKGMEKYAAKNFKHLNPPVN